MAAALRWQADHDLAEVVVDHDELTALAKAFVDGVAMGARSLTK